MGSDLVVLNQLDQLMIHLQQVQSNDMLWAPSLMLDRNVESDTECLQRAMFLAASHESDEEFSAAGSRAPE